MDSEAEFMRKTEAMFGRARRQFEAIAFTFEVKILEILVEKTPGFGNQQPDDTDYIPTGRLRGGYSLSASKLSEASRYEGGPFSDYGAETVSRLEEELRAFGIKSHYIVNDVAYAYIVRRGLGRHAAVGPRNWTGETAALSTQNAVFAEALREVGPAK